MRFTVLGLLALAALYPAPSATVVSGRAPAYVDSGGTCANPILRPRSGPMIIRVQFERAGSIVATDSIGVNMDATFTLTMPTPSTPGIYIVHARGRRAQSDYGCDTTAQFTIFDFPPARPAITVQ